MSGIAGIVNLDGAPLDRGLLSRMTLYLAPRGPDEQRTWIGEGVGFGHAMLRTTAESAAERQPLSLDGNAWIVADCRIDGRADLLRALAGRGHAVEKTAPDPELILHAYAAWGRDCVDHLLGDFAFAIWDTRERKLFCARDHFGVKTLFHARVGATVVFSNSLNCVRLHPGVSNDLEEIAIADFLVYGFPLDLEKTSFAAIRRLAPSHTLTASSDGERLHRYWQIPLEDEIRYPRRRDHIDHFLELFETAVRDRLRTRTAGVFMSGGLDSPTIAATAKRILSADGEPFDLHAHTVVFDRIVPDEERRYSGLAADAIGIPIEYYPSDDFRMPDPDPMGAGYPPEPTSLFDRERGIDIHRRPAQRARVLLGGDGADALIDALPAGALEDALRNGQLGRLASEFAWLMLVRRQVPRFGIRTAIRAALGHVAPPMVEPFPEWFNPALDLRLDLKGRWRGEAEAVLPRVGFELAHAYWAHQFAGNDPGHMGLAAETRFPFVDLRLVCYLLRLPPFPWFVEKSLLRVSMKGTLPAAVLHRPKAPLAGNPWARMLPSVRTRWWERYLAPAHGIEQFVNLTVLNAQLASVVNRTQAKNDHCDIDLLRVTLRPIGLNLWLRQVDRDRSPAID